MWTFCLALALAQEPSDAHAVDSVDAVAPEVVPPDPPVDVEALTAFLDAHGAAFGSEWGETSAFNGFVHVTDDGETIYSRGFGLADRETGAVADADTAYWIGSTTKQFAAVVLLRLVEAGKLSLDDSVQDYVNVSYDVTIAELLSHTSGIWSYTSDPKMRKRARRAHTTRQMLDWFDGRELEFAPGSSWSYSNSGYVLAGAIIESVTGEPWEQALQTWALEPAGITGIEVLDPDRPGAAVGYTVAKGGIREAMPIHHSVPHAAGNLSATARAMVAWHEALEGDALLSESSRRRMNTPVQNKYGLGVVIDEFRGERTICHGGGIFGFNHFYCRVPARDLVIVAWTNQDTFDINAVGNAALAVSLGVPVPVHREPALGSLDKVMLKPLLGEWRLTDDSRAQAMAVGLPEDFLGQVQTGVLALKRDTLTYRLAGMGQFPLKPLSDGTFIGPNSIVVRFEEERLLLSQGRLSLVFQQQ